MPAVECTVDDSRDKYSTIQFDTLTRAEEWGVSIFIGMIKSFRRSVKQVGLVTCHQLQGTMKCSQIQSQTWKLANKFAIFLTSSRTSADL